MPDDMRAKKIAECRAALEASEAYRTMMAQQQEALAAATAEHEQVEAERAMGISALVETIAIVAAADGRVSPTELGRMIDDVQELTGGQIDEEAIQSIARETLDRVCAEGADARAKAVAEIIQDTELRHLALVAASAVAYRDDGVGTKEGLALQALARAFGMSINELHRAMASAGR